MAGDINEELDKQVPLIDEIDTKVSYVMQFILADFIIIFFSLAELGEPISSKKVP
jgi:hypothetical protein